MLRLWLGVAPALVALLAAAAASAAAPRAVEEPVRLTAGASNELMGVLAADGRQLYFVSDASGTMDILRQEPVQSSPVPFSSGLGDAAWPQISPDGRRVAYLSFESDSTGDVCVREISNAGAGSQRCLTDGSSAELQVSWWDDDSLAVLSRRELHGDFSLWRLPLGGGGPSLLLARNMLGVALSPDRRWLAYVPLTRGDGDAGITFSQRTATGIGLERLGGAGGRSPISYVPPLPGASGAAAFAPDGAYLYFTQYLNDTNRDGAIDGNDNAVIFRVQFHGARAVPIGAADQPEQLTSARWDCHYPAPATQRLIVTCSHDGSLDIYSLPLDGAVPRSWSDARLEGEAAAARDPWTRLLLLSRRLALAPSVEAKESIVLEMMALHLELDEHDSAIYYGEQVLTSADARRYGRVVAQLARHRREDLALIRGETSEPYIQSERRRSDSLRDELALAPPRVAALSRLVISEIEDDIGDKAAALKAFRTLSLETVADPLAAALAGRRAEQLFRLRGEREPLLDVYRGLASLTSLGVKGRLEYAQRFVAELGRGRTRAARRAALSAARARTPSASELAFSLDAEQVLSSLNDTNQEAVRGRLFELYQANRDPDRRRALVLSSLRAAARAGNEYLQYQFVTTWASSLPYGDPERKYAEELYDSVVLDRAYGEGRQGKAGEARGYFYGAIVATNALEAHIGFIEARIAEGRSGAERELSQIYERRFAREPASPVYAFVRAYRIARELPRESDPERHDQSARRALEYLAAAVDALPNQAHIHQLWGFVLHQRARRAGSREDAVAANRHYLLALDLARDDERLTAALLSGLGLLQASLGSHGAALRHLRRRDELPYVRPLEEIGARIAAAQSSWHGSNDALAKQQMLAAEQLLVAGGGAGRFEPLVLDRLALSLAVAGEEAAARARYAELARVLESDASAAPGNRLKAEVGLAASALASGEAEVALQALARADRVLEEARELEPAPRLLRRRSLVGRYRYSPLQYRALIAGLRAGVARLRGDDVAGLRAIEQRVSLLAERLLESGADEDRLELAQAYHHLARLRYRLRDPGAAARAVETGLELSERYDENTGSDVNEAELALVRDYAELYLHAGLAIAELRRDPRAELRRAYAVICKYRSPRWAELRFLFKTYLTQMVLVGAPNVEGVPHDGSSRGPGLRSGPAARLQLRKQWRRAPGRRRRRRLYAHLRVGRVPGVRRLPRAGRTGANRRHRGHAELVDARQRLHLPARQRLGVDRQLRRLQRRPLPR